MQYHLALPAYFSDLQRGLLSRSVLQTYAIGVRFSMPLTTSEAEMLDLDDARRSELILRGALTIDDDGDEVLAGLTLAESHFYLVFEEHPVETHDTGETSLYYQLKHKHLAARAATLLGVSSMPEEAR